jgi:hypothetical protein
MGVIVRVHGRAANSGPNAQMTLTTGFAKFDISMFDVANLAYRRQALLSDQTLLA